MPEIIDREVRFDKYCKTCRYKDTPEVEDPCNECLDYPVNSYMEVPIHWEPGDGKEDKK